MAERDQFVVGDAERALVERFIESRFPESVPSPIREILRVRRLGVHFGASVVLFDGVRCILIVAGEPGLPDPERWIYRGNGGLTDELPFFYDRSKGCWVRFDGSLDEALDRFGDAVA